jgi:hypothetical protein
MPSALPSLFSSEIFLPRGHDYLWTPRLLVLESASDLTIALACLATSASLARRWLIRRAAPARRTRILLAAALGALALTHAFGVWLIWAPLYGLDAIVRCGAAAVALAAAVSSVADRGDA